MASLYLNRCRSNLALKRIGRALLDARASVKFDRLKAAAHHHHGVAAFEYAQPLEKANGTALSDSWFPRGAKLSPDLFLEESIRAHRRAIRLDDSNGPYVEALARVKFLSEGVCSFEDVCDLGQTAVELNPSQRYLAHGLMGLVSLLRMLDSQRASGEGIPCMDRDLLEQASREFDLFFEKCPDSQTSLRLMDRSLENLRLFRGLAVSCYLRDREAATEDLRIGSGFFDEERISGSIEFQELVMRMTVEDYEYSVFLEGILTSLYEA